MSNPIADPGHGHSPAAWTAVIIMLVGIAIGTFFFFLDMPIVVWIAAGIVVIGLIVGWVMARAGYGVNGSKTTAKEH
jgi:ABC-type transport system involved in cytochrome bd biosynthesis fused ATPase/permease subunit